MSFVWGFGVYDALAEVLPCLFWIWDSAQVSWVWGAVYLLS